MKESRLALSMLLCLAVQINPDRLVPKLLICNALFGKVSLPKTLEKTEGACLQTPLGFYCCQPPNIHLLPTVLLLEIRAEK